VDSMLRLSNVASRLIREIGVDACTDITGFGLVGHTVEMIERSRVRIRVFADRVPLLDGAERYAREGWLPGGAARNVAYFANRSEPKVDIDPAVPQTIVDLLFDPETSGGLLIAVPSERASLLEQTFTSLG